MLVKNLPVEEQVKFYQRSLDRLLSGADDRWFLIDKCREDLDDAQQRLANSRVSLDLTELEGH